MVSSKKLPMGGRGQKSGKFADMDGPMVLILNDCKKKTLTNARSVISLFFQSSAAFSHGKLTEIFILNCIRVTIILLETIQLCFLNGPL